MEQQHRDALSPGCSASIVADGGCSPGGGGLDADANGANGAKRRDARWHVRGRSCHGVVTVMSDVFPRRQFFFPFWALECGVRRFCDVLCIFLVFRELCCRLRISTIWDAIDWGSERGVGDPTNSWLRLLQMFRARIQDLKGQNRGPVGWVHHVLFKPQRFNGGHQLIQWNGHIHSC